MNMYRLQNKRITVLFTIVALFLTGNITISYARGQDKDISFCGGMFYRAGWCRIETPAGEISGFSPGLGGKLGFFLSPSFRLGAMGFSGSLRYDKGVHAPSSYISTGAGGLSAEFVRHMHAMRFAAGVMMGGGRLEHLHIIAVNEGSNTVSYEDYSTFLIAPVLSLEYPLSEKITAALMADWLFGNAVIAGKHYGPSLRLGILFTH